MYNPYTLENKTILVTGASSGIGRAIAIECSKMGAKLVITGRNAERLLETSNQLESTDHRQVIADLNNNSEIQNLVEQIPNLQGLVLCAGVDKRLPVKFLNKEDFEGIIQTNFFAPSFLVQQLLKKTF